MPGLGLKRMARRRIWKKKPKAVRDKNRAARQANNLAVVDSKPRIFLPPKVSCGTLAIPAQASPSATPGKLAEMFAGMPEADRAVAWSLMAKHRMSMRGAVDAVREMKI